LEQERLDCLRNNPDAYAHIWEGDYATVIDGAYFAKHLATAKQEGRIGFVARDPLMQFKATWDIGVSDACAIWISQWVGQKIVILDHYEAVGQPLEAHLNWLRSKGYGSAECILPHDGHNRNVITADRFEDHVRSAGFAVRTIGNQGRGAAMKRIEEARRLFPRMWFNEDTTAGGRDALAAYHERIDETRGIGLGPEHDWASHSADAFGLMCVAYEERDNKPPVYEMKRKWVV
jgi:phage terminase large subunit